MKASEVRLQTFCSDSMPDLFHPVEHLADVFRPDPLDVIEVHQHAREVFERLIYDGEKDSATAGRILLIKGESGSGKTHLMRAFRNFVHRFDLGFFAYMQMTTSAQRYDRYVLQKVVESLDRPYSPPQYSASSLSRVSDGVAARLPQSEIEQLQDAEPGKDANALVSRLTDWLLDSLDLGHAHVDLIRLLLYLQMDRASIRTKVTKYLRAETLSAYEQEVLGGIASRNPDDDAIEIVADFAEVARSLLGRGLVVCVDQLEDIIHLDDAGPRFRRAMDCVKQIAEIPGSVVVVACHAFFYQELKSHLTDAILNRLEFDPAPVTLETERTPQEAEALVGRRLQYLFESNEVGLEPDNPLDPLTSETVRWFTRTSTRAVLEDARLFRARSQQLGKLPARWPDGGSPIERPKGDPERLRLTQEWNDALGRELEVPEDEAKLSALLMEAVLGCGEELNMVDAFRAASVQGTTAFRIHHHEALNEKHDLLVASCEKSAKGGGLNKQMMAVEEMLAPTDRAVIVRSTAFPKSPAAAASKTLGAIIAKGGRRSVVTNADWRTILAFQAFKKENEGKPGFGDFIRSERPISRLESVREILNLGALEILKTRPTTQDLPRIPMEPMMESPEPKELGENQPKGAILLGTSLGRRGEDVHLEVQKLTRHAAFLGGTGSGKTTAALHVIENLLARGIPALLIDRKADLVGYRQVGVWGASLENRERDAFRARLKNDVDVAVYTPGHPEGRNLFLPVMPGGLGDMNDFDRDQAAQTSAQALANIMDLRGGQVAEGQKAVLGMALSFLARTEKRDLSLQDVVEFVREKDPPFLAELGGLAQFVDRLGTNLEIMLQRKRNFFDPSGERLDGAQLLGIGGASRRRARLTIISTKFLTSIQDELFWVSQLLVEVYRWASKNPSGSLQAVLLLDEADIYLPATREPPTKKPIENLLRRARSMGLGVLLASQNPGDFDYRCRDNILTWFVGRLTQSRGIEKIKEMLTEASTDARALAGQGLGEFHLLREQKAQRLKVIRNSVKIPSQVPEDEILRLAADGTAAADDLVGA